MTYFTYLPDTTYAQRHARFLAVRAEARRSLGHCQVMHDILVQASQAKLARNYIDAPVLEQAGKQIIKISNTMRGLYPVALQPDPPRHEPVTQAFDGDEARTYGGVKSSRLVRVLRFLRRLRRSHGETRVAGRVQNMSGKLLTGLDIYQRVKGLVGTLLKAMDAPEAVTTRRRGKPVSTPEQSTPSVAFTWDVSPQKTYGWKQSTAKTGYDLRQTSVYWLEKQATALKRAVGREGHVQSVRPKHRVKTQASTVQIRTFIPPKGAQCTDQIWPPIDLVRLIEERRQATEVHSKSDTHENQVREVPVPNTHITPKLLGVSKLEKTSEKYEIPAPED